MGAADGTEPWLSEGLLGTLEYPEGFTPFAQRELAFCEDDGSDDIAPTRMTSTFALSVVGLMIALVDDCSV